VFLPLPNAISQTRPSDARKSITDGQRLGSRMKRADLRQWLERTWVREGQLAVFKS
jgi:hypothetical protein